MYTDLNYKFWFPGKKLTMYLLGNNNLTVLTIIQIKLSCLGACLCLSIVKYPR